MAGNPSSLNVRRVGLGERIFDEIDEKIRKSYPESCILYIDEITNPILLERFETRRGIMISHSIDVKEIEMFHGTKTKSIQPIMEDGYKASYSTVCAYGKGTYFSPLAQLALKYTTKEKEDPTFLMGCEVSYLFLNKILVGRIKIGKNGEIIDPEKYDASCNSLKNTTIYSIQNDHAILPTYLIGFYVGTPTHR
jgi:hypothetical protein